MSDSSSFLPTTAALMPLPEASDALPVGARVGEFEIKEVIGVGGFGIVYRAWEPALEREVALKEYMPMGLVGRGLEGHVTLRARTFEADFTLGLRSFVNEARLLARFDHASLVKVHRFWEENGTAYMAMPFYKAQTLRQRRQDMGAQPPTQDWLMSMIEPLLGALGEMHRADVYHRDIAPDNILWCADNRPVLLDFGAARHVLVDRTQTLTAILKPQFAPIEQYADARAMRQGPWTDVFALASTCYFMLTGRPPLPATARILSDDLVPLAQLAPPGFSAHVLATLDWAMAVRPQDRPQSVAALWDALHGHLKVPPRVVDTFAAAERPAAEATHFDKTIQNLASSGDEPAAAKAAGDAALRPPRATSLARARATRLDAIRHQLAAHRSVLLLLVVAMVAASAWFGQSRQARDPLDAAMSDASLPGAAALLAASSPAANRVDNASIAATAPTASAALSSLAAPSRPASTSVASRAMGPREACVASKSANVEECVKRVCKSEPRFKKFDTCLRLQRKTDPWWHIFKSG